jgi:hypothetical protein
VYTVVHERGNSLLVHRFVAVLYWEYASECEVTGSQCLSHQVRRRIIMLVRTTRTHQNLVFLYSPFYCIYLISCNIFTYIVAFKCSVCNLLRVTNRVLNFRLIKMLG